MTSGTEGIERGNDFMPHVGMQCLSIQSQGMRQVNRKGEEEVGHSPLKWVRRTVSDQCGFGRRSEQLKQERMLAT